MLWISLFGFVCLVSPVLSQNGNKTSKLKFETLALGHSAILVSWDPSQEPNASNVKYHFYYQRFENKTVGRKRDTYTTSLVEDGQVKISNLEENADYQIIIERRVKRERSTEIIVETKTGAKSNKRPAKPDFKYITKLQFDHTLVAIIIWLPCGKERNCKGGTAGTHFAVKYNVKNSKQFAKLTYTADERFRIQDLFPGKTYEVRVSSINGELETESDPQEIFIPPASGPVQEVKVRPLGTSAFLLTWKAPRDAGTPITQYRITYGKSTGSLLHEDNFFRQKLTGGGSDEWQAKISKLSPNTNYTAFIIPRTESGVGTEYQIELTPQASSSLPLAKPEFTHKIIDSKDSLPKIKIRWLPCGKLQECKNSRPGSQFYVKYKSSNDVAQNTIPEFEDDYVDIYYAVPNRNYEFVVTSVDESDRVDSEKVAVRVPPIDTTITIAEAVEGQEVIFQCKAIRSSKPDIQWVLDGIPIKYGDKVVKMENGDLKLRGTLSNGVHQLVCSDQSQTNKISLTTLVVVNSPTIIENKIDFNTRQVSIGEKINLICQIKREVFNAVDVKWLKDGKDQGGEMRDPTLAFQILKVLSITVRGDQQIGNYTCVAKSHLDEDRATVSLVKKK